MHGTGAVDLIATIDVVPEHLGEVLRMLQEYGRLVRAEPGNQRFEVYSSDAPGRSVVVLERYASQAAFDAHLADPANARFNQALADLTGGLASSLEVLVAAPEGGQGAAGDPVAAAASGA